ncbi:MAG: hypothetical protein ACP5QA_04355 [Phycisphaerae bacterium]
MANLNTFKTRCLQAYFVCYFTTTGAALRGGGRTRQQIFNTPWPLTPAAPRKPRGTGS